MINAIIPHNAGSEGARELARALDVVRIKQKGSTFKGAPNKTVINWGSAELPTLAWNGTRIINPPSAVAKAVDKLGTFDILTNAGVRVPSYSRALRDAQFWMAEGSTVFARTLLRASSGRGIVVMEPLDAEVANTPAPMYVRYVPKEHEYRIHVVNGRVIDSQRKGLREEFRGQDDVNWKIRNLANGFVFVRNDGHVIPQSVHNIAIRAVAALQLDFGAVDIICTKKKVPYVLEVNTAPGLQGQTVQSYAEAFRNL